MIQAAGIGVIQTLLVTPPHDRDPDLPDAMLDAVFAQIVDDVPPAPTDARLATAVTLWRDRIRAHDAQERGATPPR